MNVPELVAATRYAPDWVAIVIIAGLLFLVLSTAAIAIKRRP